jgi:hypothetical protein
LSRERKKILRKNIPPAKRLELLKYLASDESFGYFLERKTKSARKKLQS